VISIRSASESDLDEIWRIQAVSGQAAQWNPADYLLHQCLVAVDPAAGVERMAGFAVARHTAPDELEILNVAVDPPYRRRGVARSLIQRLLTNYRGTVWLEVRQSNSAARRLYHALGFQVISVRENYYSAPPESAIVMKFHSC
jgi:[ribosomal protein S18]-alanine N-acetyltransferase